MRRERGSRLTTADEEEWRAIPGLDPDYEVSSLGNVRSWKRSGARGAKRLIRASEPTVRTPIVSKDGYHVASIMHRGASRAMRVHRLVLLAFEGPPPEGKNDGCHNDGDRLNNRLENLRWDSPKANTADKVAHGTQRRGEEMPYSVLTEKQVLEIHNALLGGRIRAELAREYGVSYGAINAIHLGANWGWLTGRQAA